MIWKRKKPDQPETATPGSESGDSPQLSDVEGVPNDMSSMAIGGAFPRATDVSSSPQVRFSDPQFLSGLDDAQVMLRVRDGDDAAFNYLVERYRRAMISFMFRMVHNAAIAEELAQEVFLRVYRSRSELRRRCQVHHLALPDRNQPGGQPRAGPQARAPGGKGQPRCGR